MTADHFEATIVLHVDRAAAWKRLTEHSILSTSDATRYWLPGFDSAVTVSEEAPDERLCATKDDQPCAGTEIVVTLSDTEAGTQITVVQSRFGDWLPARYDMMAVGWRHIVADLHAYLATGAHARRHLRAWGDFGADARPRDGGLLVEGVRPDTLADRIGLRDGDLLVVLAGAPVATYDDLVTVLRVIATLPGPVHAEWVRDGAMHTSLDGDVARQS
ncbi:MAG: SRPBCC domain-containing protein [Acidimicrobiia bacterium]